MDCSPPGSSVHGILQARRLVWVAVSFSRGSSWPRDWTHVSPALDGGFFTTEPPGKPSERLGSRYSRSGRSLGEGLEGNPLQYSCLENPLDRGAWWARVHGVTKDWIWLSHQTTTAKIHFHCPSFSSSSYVLFQNRYARPWIHLDDMYPFHHLKRMEGKLVQV